MTNEIKPGAKVRSGGLHRVGVVISLARKFRTDGAVIQWEGKPFTEWYPITNLEITE